MSVKKKRVGITLTKPYVDRLDRLVKKGLYLDHQDVIREALRQLFTDHGIPIVLKEAEG